MVEPAPAKRARVLREHGSGDAALMLSASSRVTCPEDIVDGALLPKLAKENFQSFKAACPASPMAFGLSPEKADGLELTWGSCCSGSEGVHYVVAAVEDALNDLGYYVKFKHMFSCESNKHKREWVQHVLKMGNVFQSPVDWKFAEYGCVFSDISYMRDKVAMCEHHQQDCPIVGVDFLFIGTSCKDLSRANSSVDRSKLVFSQEKSKGGSAQTFKGFIEYCQGHRPTCVLYENVDSIDDKISNSAETNLTLLMQAMGDIGYQGQKVLTDAAQFGLPCRRRRMYILFVRPDSPKLGMHSDGAIGRVFARVKTLVTACMRSPPCAEKCLLPDGHPVLQDRLKQLKIAAAKSMASKKQPQNTWIDKHMAYADQLGVRWGGPTPLALSDNEWVNTMPKREVDALRLSQVEGPTCAFRNLSQSVGRINAYSQQCSPKQLAPTMLPGQQLWMESRQRLMVGEEALMFQGFPILLLQDLQDKCGLPAACSSHSFLQDLAGNAMALPVAMAMFQAGVASLPWIPRRDDASDPGAEDVATALAAVALLKQRQPRPLAR